MRGRFADIWMECGDGEPPAARTYSPREQAANGKDLARFVDRLRTEARRPPASPEAAAEVRERLVAAGGGLARTALGWDERHLAVVLSGGFERPGIEFTRAARALGPDLDADDVLQAARNVWVANGLQKLLGLPVRLTPAITAYSLLYPHTDNYLDDPAVSRESKREFNGRLKARLEGRAVEPANPAEKAVFDLVSMIEGEYDRVSYPRVFESLSEIHRAQVESLALLRPDGSPYEADVLGISLDKGGTSVLADAFLVAGSLDPARLEFAYGLGAFLQLMDDLEDVFEDLKAGRMTVFSQTSKGWFLDGVTDHVLRFGERVLAPLGGVAVPGTEAIQDLVRSVTRMGIIDCAGRAGRLYSRDYIARLEARSPFRFAFAIKQTEEAVKAERGHPPPVPGHGRLRFLNPPSPPFSKGGQSTAPYRTGTLIGVSFLDGNNQGVRPGPLLPAPGRYIIPYREPFFHRGVEMKRICYGPGIILVFALSFAGYAFAGSVPDRRMSFDLTVGVTADTSLSGILFTVGAQGTIPAGKTLSIRPELQLGYVFGFGLLALPALLVDMDFKNSFVGAGIALGAVVGGEEGLGVIPAWKVHAGIRRGRVTVTGSLTMASFWESHYGLVGITIGYRF